MDFTHRVLITDRVQLYCYQDDITERKQVEDDLSRHAEQLIMQNAELDAFGHTVAHDLKNPISLVKGFGTILAEDYETMTLEELANVSCRILHAGEKLDRIVEELCC